jgi:membrane protease YdiL (CAAX protease family)
MSELRPPQARDLASFGEGLTCQYCNAPLDRRMYFCQSCATPYKEPESVLTPIRELRPSTGELVNKLAPNVKTLLLSYLAVIVGMSVILGTVAGGQHMGVHVLLMDVVLLVTTVYFSVHYWPSLVQQFKRLGFDHWAAWVGLLLLVPLLGLNYAYHDWMQSILTFEEEGGGLVSQLRKDGFTEAMLVLSIAIFPAISEEIAFRGLIQHWLQVALRPMMAISVAAAMFAAVHFSVISFPILFLAGWLMGWVKWKTGSLYPSMLIHFLHNLAVVKLFDA